MNVFQSTFEIENYSKLSLNNLTVVVVVVVVDVVAVVFTGQLSKVQQLHVEHQQQKQKRCLNQSQPSSDLCPQQHDSSD